MKKTAFFLMGTAALAFLVGILLLGETSKTLSYIDAYSADFSFLKPHSNMASVLGASTAWYNSSWNYRKAITIDHTKVSGSLSNFPVLISITDAEIKASAKADGGDFIFTDADGTTKLDHEIEKYNSATGELIVWVRVPTLSPSVDHTLYIYFGNASASNQQNPTGVWDSNFIGVYHLGNGTILNTNDSKGIYNGTAAGTSVTVGQIDGAASFNNGSSYIYNNSFTDSANSVTFSAWANQTTNDSNYHSIADMNWGQVQLKVNNGHVTWAVGNGGWNACDYSYGGIVNQKHLYTGTYDSSNNAWLMYIDGAQVKNCPWTGTPGFANLPVLTLGATYRGAGSEFFGGMIDEFRASKIARSADWIKTEYNNQSSPSTFYAIGGLEQYTSGIDTNRPPTVPAGLSVVNSTPTSITLSWSASSDTGNGVAGYDIYRNGVKIASINPATYVNTDVNSPNYVYYLDTGLSASTAFTYTINAYDAIGNTSTQSSNLQARTLNQPAPSSPQWNMGYYISSNSTPSLPVSAIYWPSLTHIVHGPASPLADGTLDLSYYPVASNASALISAAHARNVKVLLFVVDGWPSADGPGGSNNFPSATANHMTTFVNNIINTVNTYGYDGVDIDWESNINWTSMAALLSKLRTALGTKLLTAAAGEWMGVSNWTPLSSYLDRVDVMTYDIAGPWNLFMWYDSPLYNISGVSSLDSTKQAFLGAGIPASKINLGLPFYGYTAQGGCQTSGCLDGLYAPLQTWSTAPSWTQENEIIQTSNYDLTPSNPNWHWDVYTHEPYLSINNSGATSDKFVTFENAQSITDKVNYVQSNNLGGVFNWNMNADYFSSGSTAAEKYPLSNAVAQAMGTVTPPSDTTPPSIPSGLSATAISSTQINLSWTASTDNVGVTGYKVYRAGTQIAAVTSGTTYQNIGLSASTNYSYTVSAYDAAGNTSSLSVSVSATTLSGIPIPGDFNLDHIVNSLDFSLLNTNWFKTNNISLYDLQVDGTVNSFDFAIFKSNWGKVW